MREAILKRFEKICDLPNFPTIGNNETRILNLIEKVKNIVLERQFKVCGYLVDGYDKINNICYEVDERWHNKPDVKQRDKIRQKEIEEELDCTFVRIGEKQFLKIFCNN